MKLNLIRDYKSLPFNSLKKLVRENKIIKPALLGRIRKKKSLTDIVEEHNYQRALVFIQSHIRRKIAQNKLKDFKSQTVYKDDKFNNDSNLLGDDILKDVPDYYRYKFNNYIFDLRELYKNYKINQKFINPYTNEKLPKETQNQIKRIFWRIENKKIPLILPNEQPINSISLLFNNFYDKLSDLDCYPNINSFNNHTIDELNIYIHNILRNELIYRNLIYSSYYRNYLRILFSRINPKYYEIYTINNFYNNPYLNYNYNSPLIKNHISITDSDYQMYIDNDKHIIERFIKSCFDILQVILENPEHKDSMAILVNDMIDEPLDDIFEDNIYVII